MERLEAALEKARTDRRVTQSTIRPISDNVSFATHESDRWNALKQITISPRLARKKRITALKQGKDSGPYDLLRSRALRLMGENNWSTLAVTSPNKTCGKTTLCTNLALSFGRQPELRVLVLDLDLRRPALHKILGHRSENSLHEVLAGKYPIDTAFVRATPNLAFALNNTPADNPSELLQSKMTRTKLNEIKEAFEPDLMIFDMPPMLASDENVGFLPSVDCGILVGAADNTTITQLDICEKELSELTNVLGVVLNKCRFNEKDSGYDYDYQ
ncbi:MAG: AAA family ATPase [Paracoccaceae bacterium]